MSFSAFRTPATRVCLTGLSGLGTLEYPEEAGTENPRFASRSAGIASGIWWGNSIGIEISSNLTHSLIRNPRWDKTRLRESR